MNHNSPKDTTLNLKIDTFDLNNSQVRLLKHINTLLVHVLSAEDEAEYFEISAELIKQTATLIKTSNYLSGSAAQKNMIAQQAVEYAIDFLNEKLSEENSILLDN